jgi:predicted transporter
MVHAPGKTAFFTVLIAAWLALTVIFAGVFVIVEHDHEHIDVSGRKVPSGEDCHICFEIQIALRLIEAFGRLGLILAIIGFTPCAVSFIKPQMLFCSKGPIELKVRFNC